MANLIQLKRSSVVGKIPDTGNVEVGEPVVNLADRKIFTKNGSSEIIQIAAGNLQALGDVSNATPNTNDVLTWTGSIWSPAISVGGSGGSSNVTVTVSASPPSPANIADIWIDSDTSIQYIYFNDGDSSQWVQLDAIVSVSSSANIDGKANVTDLTTANVFEVTNLYFTNTRVQDYLTDNDYQTATSILANTLTISGDGNDEIQYNDGGILSSNPGFYYTGNILYVNYDTDGEIYTNALTANTTITTYGTLTASGDIESLSDVIGVNLFGELTGNVTGTVSTLSNHTTDNLLEGGNLYFTNARVYSNVIELGYITVTALNGYATNVQLDSYATTANLDLKANIADLTTANVAEVTNLYFTNTRVVAALTAGENISLEANGLISSSASGGVTTGKAIAMAIVFG